MSNNGAPQVLGSDGKMHAVEPIVLREAQVKELSNFVLAHVKEYRQFQNHSLQSCIETILTRGKAEIERYIKTNHEREKDQAAGDLFEEYDMSPVNAQDLAMLRDALQKVREQRVTVGQTATKV